uniref:Uncharacterized protein n=1 Tax=Ditylenchus dipsaci TaxID=166011 RepID=A0A915DHC3_9BILA
MFFIQIVLLEKQQILAEHHEEKPFKTLQHTHFYKSLPTTSFATSSNHLSAFTTTKNPIEPQPAYSSRQFHNSHQHIYLFILVLLCLLSPTLSGTNSARSCKDHYLSGHNSLSSHLPLPLSQGDDAQEVFWVDCQFPPPSSQQSSHLSVVTVIHNGVEQWHWLGDESAKKTVGYQISNWQYLRSIMSESDGCAQELLIKWPPVSATGPYSAPSSWAEPIVSKNKKRD